MSRIVRNPLLNKNVIISPTRKKRPFQVKSICPFCIGSKEVPEKLDHVISLANKFPTLSMESNARGICEVILYSSEHDIPLGYQNLLFIQNVIRHWIKRDQEISEIKEIEYIFIFENYGKEIGVSLEHPHGQLYAFDFIPEIINKKEKNFREQCFYCSDIKSLYETDTFNVIVPEFAKWPFELHIIPKRHLSKLSQLNNKEISDLAILMKKSFTALFTRFNKKIPYIFSIYQAGVKDNTDNFHLHIELISPQITENRLKYRAGVETSLGIFINSIDPKVLADEIRAQMRSE